MKRKHSCIGEFAQVRLPAETVLSQESSNKNHFLIVGQQTATYDLGNLFSCSASPFS